MQDSVENVQSAGLANGSLRSDRDLPRAGANIIDTSMASVSNAAVESLHRSAIDLTVVLDQTTTIRASVFE